jgi:sensor histidine kinase YesM
MAGTNLGVQYLAGFPKEAILYNSVTPMLVGFIITTLYRYAIRRLDWSKWTLDRMLILLLGSTLLVSAFFQFSTYSIVRFLSGTKDFSLATYLSSMFIFSLIILSWNLIYFSIHYFNNWSEAQTEKWKLAAEMREAQLASLKTQINPHFVFNSINNIRALILENKDKARDMLLHFSDLFRYSLKNTDQSTVELQEELEVVNQYLELLTIQFESKLQYEIRVEEGLESMTIPPMILQLLVENAVKHGISQQSEGGHITIDIEKKADIFHISVQNTGKLNQSAALDKKMGVGLENIRRRLELIYEGKASMTIREVEENVHATLKIPIP